MIIGIAGKMSSGKDLCAEVIQNLTRSLSPEGEPAFLLPSPWKIKRFAFKLKQIASLMLGIRVELFEERRIKAHYLREWGMTVREFLQRIGTDAIRDNLHQNAWVLSLMSEYKEGDDWIITDLRFINEFDAVKEKGGICIRVIRDDIQDINPDGHESETALDSHSLNGQFDYYIRANKGDIDSIKKQINEILVASYFFKGYIHT